MAFTKQISLVLVASSTSGIAQAQNGTPNTALTLNGGLVSGGIAVFDVPRRVGVTSAGNDSAITFKIAGTDYWGNPQTETLTGAGTSVAQTVRDFSTVTAITPSSTTSSTVQAGTTGVGSSPPWVVDQWVNPASIGVGTTVGSLPVTYTIENSYNDYSPQWNITLNPPTWYPMNGFDAITTNNNDFTNQPITMARVTVNSGTGSVTANFRQAFIAGRG
jgi:hypothetical protein